MPRTVKFHVLSSEPVDQHLLQDLAANLGEITLYTGMTLRKVSAPQTAAPSRLIRPSAARNFHPTPASPKASPRGK